MDDLYQTTSAPSDLLFPPRNLTSSASAPGTPASFRGVHPGFLGMPPELSLNDNSRPMEGLQTTGPSVAPTQQDTYGWTASTASNPAADASTRLPLRPKPIVLSQQQFTVALETVKEDAFQRAARNDPTLLSAQIQGLSNKIDAHSQQIAQLARAQHQQSMATDAKLQELQVRQDTLNETMLLTGKVVEKACSSVSGEIHVSDMLSKAFDSSAWKSRLDEVSKQLSESRISGASQTKDMYDCMERLNLEAKERYGKLDALASSLQGMITDLQSAEGSC